MGKTFHNRIISIQFYGPGNAIEFICQNIFHTLYTRTENVHTSIIKTKITICVL